MRGPKKGKYKLHAEAFNTGPAGDAYPHQLLATLRSRGHKVDPIPLPSVFPPVTDLSELPLDFTRKVVFNDTDNPDVFVIDHKVYDHDRIDQMVRLGDLEEWTVQNKSQELHVFHIHQTDFQVTEINGVRQPFTGYQDTVTLPIATKKGPGEIKIRIPFTNPLIVGKFVYHCHIVQHADQGMMANIEVVQSLCEARREQPEISCAFFSSVESIGAAYARGALVHFVGSQADRHSRRNSQESIWRMAYSVWFV